MTLTELAPGETAAIESIDTGDPSVLRLMVLGLVEGAELTYVRASIGGDPLEFRMFGSAISLRREQAKRFHVSLVSGNR
ncbi:MAG: FeoA family protein [Gammaproteobacteria bacterium]|nr:FeoA family protein [Gammaproteobacteria bacterium]